MLNKKIMMLAIFLVSLLAISAVSATNNATSDVVSVEETTVDVVKETTDEVVSVKNDNQVITERNTSVGSFDDLQTEINNVEEGRVLNLTKDYKYANGSTEGIEINKPITIDGKGHTLDGNNLSRIFLIQSDNIILKNIQFKNAFNYKSGGAIEGYGDNITIDKCCFINCSVHSDSESGVSGGAIYFKNPSGKQKGNISIVNSIFDKCSSYSDSHSGAYAGAIYIGSWLTNVIDNCTFVNCYANGDEEATGGAIRTSISNITNCNFKNCFVLSGGYFSYPEGGAIYSSTTDVINCNFTNCYALLSRDEMGCVYGGAILVSTGNVYNSHFVNCYVQVKNKFGIGEDLYARGGAICSVGKLIVGNSTFLNCSSFSSLRTPNLFASGGAIDYSDDTSGKSVMIAYMNKFINCSANSLNQYSYGGAISSQYTNNITNCSFISNSAYNGGAISSQYTNNITNCSFISNSAYNGGAIFYDNSKNNNVDNSSFISNSAYNGGAIFVQNSRYYLKYVSIFNSYFENNYASKLGKSIFFNESKGIINNSYFVEALDNIVLDNSDVNVIKRDTSVSSADYSFDYKNWSIISAILSHNHNNLTYKKLLFEFNNGISSKIFTVNTNEYGVAFLNDDLNEIYSGIWNLTIIFEGDDNYYPSNATHTINVLRLITSLTIDDVNTAVGNEVTLIATVNSTSHINEGVVSFFDGETNIGEGNVTGGVATLIYTPTTAGKHTITAFYNSDNNYKSSNTTASLLVAKANTELNIDYISSVYFTTTNNFAVNITSNNNAVNEGKVKFYVNDVLVSSSDVISGVVNFDYIADMAGFFTFAIVYNGTENYFASNITGNFYVSPMPTSLNGETKFFDEEQNKTFTVELKDINNNGVYNQFIKIEAVKYSGESITITSWTDEKGIAIFDVNNLSGGMWIVRGIYDGNDNYIGSTFTDRFIVVRMNTTTTIEEITNPQVNQSYRLKANIHDEHGKLVKEGIVQFYLDGVYIGSIDLSKNNGHQNTLGNNVLRAVNPIFEYVLGDEDVSDLYINYVPTETGEHSLTAVYEGTTIYKSSNSTTTFIVTNKDVATIDAPSVTSDFNDGSYLFATLKDSAGNGIKDCAISIELNGVVNILTTDSNGEVNLSLDNMGPGSYVAIIAFEGNDDYLETSISTNVTINKLETEIDVNVANVEYGQSVDINVTLDSVASGVVVLELNKQNYTESLVNGKCVFTIPNLEIGNYVIKVIYGGDEYYKGTDSIASFEVTKVKIQDIEIPEILSNNDMLKISLPDDAAGTVTLIINGKEYVSDVVNGDVNINISDLSAGDYPYVITYSGDAKYLSFAVSGSLKVNKTNPENKTVDPEVVVPPLDNPSSDGSIPITLPSDATGTVTLVIGGKAYSFPVVNGVANVYMPDLSNGDYNYTITYSGDGKYSSFTNSSSLNVNKVLSTVIVASNIVTVYNGGKYLMITLKDQNGKAVSNVKVTVKFSNGKVLTGTTDKIGRAKFSTNGLVPVKVYTATITFAGNANYAKSSKIVKVGVKKANPKIIASAKAYKVRAVKKYTVALKTNRNVVMKNTLVTIKVGKITLNARTNAKGIATFNLAKLAKKGNYKTVITYKGNNYYNKATKTVYIRVV